MTHIPIKLGPLAVLFAVISICMTTLGILAFTTARADFSLAEEYADTVRTRYELEAEGQRFLQTAARSLQEGTDLKMLDNTETDEEGIVWRTFEKGEFGLRVGVMEESGTLRIVNWRLQKEWELDEDMNLWSGEE